MSMYNRLEINRYQTVINQDGHPLALVSIGTTLCEKSLRIEELGMSKQASSGFEIMFSKPRTLPMTDQQHCFEWPVLQRHMSHEFFSKKKVIITSRRKR